MRYYGSKCNKMPRTNGDDAASLEVILIGFA